MNSSPVTTLTNPETNITHRILVLGGTGFIGRHVVAALNASRARVLIGSREPVRHERNYPDAEFRAARLENLLSPDSWIPLIDGVDVIVNCVGILRQRPNESYDNIHHRAPAALSVACAAANVRLIHTSALGLHEGAKSRFLSSKLSGERAVAASGADYSIVRPSLLDGEGGFGASWLRGLSRSPVHFIPRAACGNIAAMTATDLGIAIAALTKLPSLHNHREVELGGARCYEYAEYLRTLRATYTDAKALQIPLPNWLARIGAHVCDGLHFSPFSYGHWILLQRDNVPSPNRLPELLSAAPSPIAMPLHPLPAIAVAK
jgi:uncharacterized protein YbjT (DUF2867 family)